MSKNSELHIRRLTEAKAQIVSWKTGSDNALTPAFSDWKRRIEHSLGELFGEDHHYARHFRGLAFWLSRVIVGQAGVRWTTQDQERFAADLSRAESILGDALDEFQSLS